MFLFWCGFFFGLLCILFLVEFWSIKRNHREERVVNPMRRMTKETSFFQEGKDPFVFLGAW